MLCSTKETRLLQRDETVFNIDNIVEFGVLYYILYVFLKLHGFCHVCVLI
jgi:hypothetical protein